MTCHTQPPASRRTGLTALLVPGLALALLLGGAWSAQAGTLDRGLMANSGDVLEFAKQQGWKNIGVLPFQVQRGTRMSSFNGGPLSNNITRRLENALIMSMEADEARAIGIIRDAVSTANQAKVGPYLSNDAAFRKLFATTYHLAWGGKQVKADGFLTGRIINTGDRSKTTVIITAFDASHRKGGKLIAQRVAEFTIDTDRMLAADLGYNFALKPSLVASRSMKPTRRDQTVWEEIRDEENGQQPGQRPGGQPGGQPGQLTGAQSPDHTPSNIAGFQYELLYDGVSQTLTPVTGTQQGSQATEYQAPPAMAGSNVSMALTRVSDEARKLGAVILINGQSTWQKQDMEPIQCQKWLYDQSRRGQRDLYEGFYTEVSGRNLLRFRALTAEESVVKASELGNRAGWIDVYVFASSDGGKGTGDEGDMLISTRGMPKVRSRSQSLAALQSGLMQSNNVRQKKALVRKRSIGGLLLHELEPVESPEISVDSLPNPVLIGHMAIRYWDGSGQQGTVQPGGFQQTGRPQQGVRPQQGTSQPLSPFPQDRP